MPALDQSGAIVRGGRLVVEYDPARVRVVTPEGWEASRVRCSVRFAPGGQVEKGVIADAAQLASGALCRFAVDVPQDAYAAEVWFELETDEGESRWDSNFGHNYRFEIGE